MLIVDDIRRELEKTGELPSRARRGRPRDETIPAADDRKEPFIDTEEDEMRGRIGARKEARSIPEKIKARWIWTARSAELETVLKERFGVSDDLSEKSGMDKRRMLQKLLSGNRKKEKSARGGDASLKHLKPGPPAQADEVKPRLVLAQTFPCPSCGAQLMIERG